MSEMTIGWWQRATADAARARRARDPRNEAEPDSRRIVVFTDPNTLSGEGVFWLGATRDTLKALADRGVVVVLWGNETRAELELIQQDLDVRHPFISENGGGLFLPRGYFPSTPSAARPSGGYAVIDFGRPYHRVAESLHDVADKIRIRVRSFRDMSIRQVADECRLSLSQARLAKLREYDEPFRIDSPDPAIQSRLFTAMRQAGLRCFTHGRYHHATSVVDQTASIRMLTSLYREAGTEVVTVGLATDPFETCLLQRVDIPVVVQNESADAARLLHKVPTARFTDASGPRGWSDAIWDLVNGETR